MRKILFHVRQRNASRETFALVNLSGTLSNFVDILYYLMTLFSPYLFSLNTNYIFYNLRNFIFVCMKNSPRYTEVGQ